MPERGSPPGFRCRPCSRASPIRKHVHDNTLEHYDGPLVDVGMVVEGNRFEHSRFGISVGDGVSGLLRANRFKGVETPVRVKDHSDVLQK